MSSTYRAKYGIDWDPNMSDIQIELNCAKKWREPELKAGKLGHPADHLLRAVREIFPPRAPNNPFIISPWTEEHAVDWTTELFCITWGCASSSKSNDYGLFTYLDWATDPTQTYTILASTDKLALQRRSYESVMRYFQILRARNQGWPGLRSKQKLAIVFEDDVNDGEMSSDKASITGVAVMEGTTDEARARLQGVHLPYVRIVADELSGMRRAIMEARFNLAIGPKDFRFFGLCNPDSLTDLAAEHSIPLRGWSSIDENTLEWRSIYGKVRHHNGFYSPAVLEPDGAKKYPNIINQAHIDTVIQTSGNNLDHPQVWTMVRGFPPPRGLETTVISEKDVVTFNMQEPPVWEKLIGRVAGLDPAFTSGGDGCIFVPAEYGILTTGQLAIAFLPEVELAISASDSRPVTYQIVDQLRVLLNQHQIPVDQLGIDDSGTQSVADVVAVEIAAGSQRVVFNGKASDRPLAPGGQQPADKKVGNAITELYYYFAALGAQGQVRGLSQDAMKQFCSRRVLRKGSLWRLEEKKDLKQRIKRSPDVADACACALAVLRFKLGVAPGASHTAPTGPALIANPVDRARLLRINNLYSRYR